MIIYSIQELLLKTNLDLLINTTLLIFQRKLFSGSFELLGWTFHCDTCPKLDQTGNYCRKDISVKSFLWFCLVLWLGYNLITYIN